MVWGGAETRAAAWRELFDRLTVADRTSLEVPGAGHEYGGSEAVVTGAVTGFVDAHL